MVGDVLGLVTRQKLAEADLLEVVALLAGDAAQGLAAGQVGTVVESLDLRTVLVEFSDEDGRAYAIAPCRRADLLVLRYAPEAAA